MTDGRRDDVIRALERLADRAWPAAEVEEHDGWLLRWDQGPWNRTNSVAPVRDGRAPLAAKIDHAERWYLERGREPKFKLTATARPPELEDVLRRRGYEAGFSVSVRTRPIETARPPAGVVIERHPTPLWLEAKARIGGRGERTRHLPALLGRIADPAAFASAAVGNTVAGIGLAVVTEEHAGIFDLAVDPDHRRRGLATAVIGALSSWAAERGATRAYLQVETSNRPALELYDRLGFCEVYRYWYRVLR